MFFVSFRFYSRFRKKFRLPAHLAMEFIEKLKVLTNNNDERLNRCSRIPFYLRVRT